MFFWLILYEKPEKQKRLSKAELDYIQSDKEVNEADTNEKVSWTKLLGYKQTWAFRFWKVYDRWCLVVFPVLASCIFEF
jgi:ACS family hexuronate transporter-like MFS transporter